MLLSLRMTPLVLAQVTIPDVAAAEFRRRELATSLQRGWGTFWNPSVLTYVLLPQSFAVMVGFYRISTGQYFHPVVS